MGDAGAIAKLDSDDLKILTRGVEGHGGMQSFLRALLPRIQADGSLTLSSAEVERVRKYAEDYGKGGFQDRFRLILRRTEPPQSSLEDEW